MLTLWVDKQGLLASNWVCADNWVLRDDWLAADDTTSPSGTLNLLDARVGSLQAVKSLLELWAQAIISLDLVNEDGITASSRLIEDVEEGGCRWLLLVGNVRVPCNRGSVSLEVAGGESVTGTTVNEVNLWVSLWRARGWVDVMTAKVSTVLEGLVDWKVGKVLVAECNDLALGDETGELVLAGVGESRELNAIDLSADGWGKVDGGYSLWKEVLVGGVGIFAMVVVLVWSQCWVLLLWVESWEVVLVLRR